MTVCLVCRLCEGGGGVAVLSLDANRERVSLAPTFAKDKKTQLLWYVQMYVRCCMQRGEEDAGIMARSRPADSPLINSKHAWRSASSQDGPWLFCRR